MNEEKIKEPVVNQTENEDTAPATEERIRDKYKCLNIFVNSDLSNNQQSLDEWAHENKLIDPNGFKGLLLSRIIELGKDLKLEKKDFTDTYVEIGLVVNEETALKARALLGRLVVNACYMETLLFFEAVIKYTIYYNDEKSIGAGLFGDEGDDTINCFLPAIISVGWCILIESNVCAQKEVHDQKNYMPETLPTVIFMDRMSRWYFPSYFGGNGRQKHLQFNLFSVWMDFFINNILRYEDKAPHQSEICYMNVVKAAYERLGGDPSKYVYSSLNNGKYNWSLFQFLTIPIK